MIRETILTTAAADGRLHIAPIGIIADAEGWIVAPFQPSTTLDNLQAVPFAVANHTEDVRVFAGCLTGRTQWATVPADEVPVARLADALAHVELAVERVSEDPQRPRFHCRVLRMIAHAPFAGFNRAQGAVIEAAILVSRLGFLPRAKVETELAYLRIAVDKTAGPAEREAWEWLMRKVTDHYACEA